MQQPSKTKYITKDHLTFVPLNWDDTAGQKIEVFAREIYLPKNKNKDIFVFLQGGPGFASPRDIEGTAWIVELLKKFRVVLLDQRGTGRSQKIGPELAEQGLSEEALFKYFSYHRADSIVKDLEHLRAKVFKVNKWFLLGQSYGGFVIFSYLSFFPQSVKGALVTGGVPPLSVNSVDQIYKRLSEVVFQRNMEFYKQYPKDAARIRKIFDLLLEKPYLLPDGGQLTAERFQYIGLDILGQDRPLESLHNFLDDPFLDSSEQQLSYSFAMQCSGFRLSFETNPIYSILHESIYCNGISSKWSAERQLKEHKGFELKSSKPCFMGEAIRKSLFEDFAQLRGFKNVAHQIANHTWTKIYDLKQLEQNPVPVECLLYKSDYYVDYDLALKAVEIVKGVKQLTHPTWQHDGLRRNGKEVINKLLPRLMKRVHASAKR